MASHTKQSRTARVVREQAPVAVKSPSAEQTAKLEIYDTTLRDGAQAEDVSFSAADKVLIAQKLDSLGVHFIEGGWPGANPKILNSFG